MPNVYSLADTRTVLEHPNVGTGNLHLCGAGKIVVSWSGDLSSHTVTADGYVVVNRLPTRAQNVVKITVDVLMAFLCSYMFYLSIIYVLRSYRKPTAILGISSATVSVSLTLAFLDMAIWSIIFIRRDLRSIKENGRVVGEEGA